MKEKESICKLVSNGRTAEALDKLLSTDLPPKDRIIVAQIKASFEQLRRDTIKGILSFEQQTTEQNRINDRMLRFLNGEDEQPPLSPMTETQLILEYLNDPAAYFENLDQALRCLEAANKNDVNRQMAQQFYQHAAAGSNILPDTPLRKLLFDRLNNLR
jgi:hypothetical protein